MWSARSLCLDASRSFVCARADGNGLLDIFCFGSSTAWYFVNGYTSTTSLGVFTYNTHATAYTMPWGVVGDFDANGLADVAGGYTGINSFTYVGTFNAYASLNPMCTAGKYSATGTNPCQSCSAGFSCVPGTEVASPQDQICVSGRFSTGGAATCTLCRCGDPKTCACVCVCDRVCVTECV